MPDQSTFSTDDYIGAGRSATVYRQIGPDNTEIACKVFTSDTLSRIILYILTGAANPYTWCPHAMAAAVSRRAILSLLVEYWFKGKLRLPKTYGSGWNSQSNAFELRAELIKGTHAPLLEPLATEPVDYFDDLYYEIMKPLQQYLLASGFDGLVWQAGYGNPVAANNFMLEQSDGALPSWVWIDLESGVPALFALNPLKTIGYYLPKSLHHGRWLFDDVDIDQLMIYVEEHRKDLQNVLGESSVQQLYHEIDVLDSHQKQWRAIGRTARSVQYALSQKRISSEQADYYLRHPLRWQTILIAKASQKALRKLQAFPKRLLTWAKAFDLKRLQKRAWNYTTSTRFRWGVARWFVARRIKSWTARGYLPKEAAFRLRKLLHHDDSSAYLTDFSVHIAIKPLADVIAWGFLPLLWMAGTVSETLLPILIVLIGPILRVSYTSTRIAQEITRRQQPQWVALGVGALPVFGNLAYPTQLLYRSTENTGELARFIIYDICAAIGRKIPIWGGSDTQTEHQFNRLSDTMIRWLNQVTERKSQLKSAQKSTHNEESA